MWRYGRDSSSEGRPGLEKAMGDARGEGIKARKLDETTKGGRAATKRDQDQAIQ